MNALAPKFPLTVDADDGYKMVRNYRPLVRQNLLNLLFTNPGERVMMPRFGVGINRMLFEFGNSPIVDTVMADIVLQAGQYLPYITIEDITLNQKDTTAGSMVDESVAILKIVYTIDPIGVTEAVDLDVATKIGEVY